MSRPLRIEYPGAWYHVMNIGRRKEKIFLKRKDYLTFIELLKEAGELWNVNVAAFSLMPNHFHLLIRTPNGNLSRFMRHLGGIYTQKFNKNNNFEGQLFKGRFKSILVDGDDYLIQLLRYIHNNSIRAKLVKKIDDFEWSSHQGYISKSKEWNWLFKEFMLSIFSNKKKNQLAAYWNFIQEKDKKDLVKHLDGPKWPSFLGSDDFVFTVKEKYYQDKNDLEVTESARLAPGFSEIKKVVCTLYDIEENSLYISRRGVYNEPRSAAIYLARQLRRDTLEKIGEEFFLKRFSSVSSSLNKTREYMKKDKKVLNRIQQLQKLLTNSQT